MIWTVFASSGVKPSSIKRLDRHFDGLGTVLADPPDQPLRTDEVDRGGDQERFDAHVHQTGDRFRRAVGVQCGQDQVAGESGLDGDFGGFKVSNFTDQNDVGVLAKEGAQRGREVQADLFLHLHLVDAAPTGIRPDLRRS